VIEAAYEETRKRILSTPFFDSIGEPAPAAAVV
jgi:hypothetical protein